jgi:hypothetical protein
MITKKRRITVIWIALSGLYLQSRNEKKTYLQITYYHTSRAFEQSLTKANMTNHFFQLAAKTLEMS